MKAIFLDIDGVLKTSASIKDTKDHFKLDPVCCEQLNRLLSAYPDARLVLTAAWAKIYPIDRMRDLLTANGVQLGDRVVDATKQHRTGLREKEIDYWLDCHYAKEEKFIVIDDEPSRLLKYNGELIKTTFDKGLTEELVNQAIQKLA